MTHPYQDSEFRALTRSTVPQLVYWRDHRTALAVLSAGIGLDLDEAAVTFEAKTPVHGGKASCTDVLIESGEVAIAIEAKWTEGRYQTVAAWHDGSENRNQVLRQWIDLIRRRSSCTAEVDLSTAVYQMVHRTASACARPAAQARVVYQVFDDERHAVDYEGDLARLARLIQPTESLELWIQRTPIARASAYDEIEERLRRVPQEKTFSLIRHAAEELDLFLFGQSSFVQIG